MTSDRHTDSAPDRKPAPVYGERLLVPMRAEADGIIGDGLVEIGPEHPDYAGWLAWLQANASQIDAK